MPSAQLGCAFSALSLNNPGCQLTNIYITQSTLAEIRPGVLRETVHFASLAGAEPAGESEEQVCVKLPPPPAQLLTQEPAALASSEVYPSSLKQTCEKKKK